ncbi:hypothetical protein Angca_008381 [Angiostrongylus cantonensis]|nr:hypothetical protein Angca_008381 [Angiostrongylus cantonensis]
MSYGGYGNRGYDYHQRRERINEDEVPESKHTIFIRGLPGDMSTDEIKEYFEDRIGPVSFDFVKTSADQQRLFVAVRFETRDDAKEAMSKYSENDLMGHRCELSWFKDIRRYAQYQNLNQRRGRQMFRNRTYQHNGGRGRDSFKRRYSERDDDKSRSRSRDRGRSSSYSRSPSARSGESSRTRSHSSERGASEERNRRSPSPDSSSDQGIGREKDKERDGDPEKKRRKKDKKNKKSKKKRSRTASRSSSEERSSTPERAIFGRHAPAGSPVSPNQEDSPTTPAVPVPANTEAEHVSVPAPLPPANPTPITVRFPLRSQNPANVISNTTFAIGIDSDELPRRVLRRMSPNAPMVTPPSVAAQEEEKMPQDMPPKESQQNVVTTIGLPPPPCPPSFASEKKSLESNDGNSETQNKKSTTPTPDPPVPVSMQQNATSIPTPPVTTSISCDGGSTKSHPSRFPTSARFFASLKEIQSSIIKTVKAEPKSDEASGGLRLSNLAMCQQDADEEKRAVREGRLSKLDEISLERFMVKKKRLEETFRGDCQTYAFVARKLIEKDPSLESQLRIALIENMEDLEKQVYEQGSK